MDRFGHKRARCWPADSIRKPTTLMWVRKMIMEGLITYGTPWKPSGWIKFSILVAIFGRFFGHFKTLFRAFLAQRERMWRFFWLPVFQNTSLVLYKGNEILKHLSKASDTAKQSKPLAVEGCQKIFWKGYLRPLLPTGLGVKGQDIDLRIAY